MLDILVVEDDIYTATSLVRALESFNHQVTLSGSRNDALNKIRGKKFDLVMLDIFLPDGEGHEVIPEMKALWHDIGIITMTGHKVSFMASSVVI